MTRRYGNRPGLIMALLLLASAGALLLIYPTGLEHRLVLLVACVVGVLVAGHAREYWRAARSIGRR